MEWNGMDGRGGTRPSLLAISFFSRHSFLFLSSARTQKRERAWPCRRAGGPGAWAGRDMRDDGDEMDGGGSSAGCPGMRVCLFCRARARELRDPMFAWLLVRAVRAGGGCVCAWSVSRRAGRTSRREREEVGCQASVATPFFFRSLSLEMSSLTSWWRTTPSTEDASVSEADALADLDARLAATPEVERQLRAGGECGLAAPGGGLGVPTLRRWLVAEKWDVDSAFARLVTHARWRVDYVCVGVERERGARERRRGGGPIADAAAGASPLSSLSISSPLSCTGPARLHRRGALCVSVDRETGMAAARVGGCWGGGRGC